MKPYILQITHLGKAIEGQYVAHIDIMDSDKHCFTGIPYKTIVINAINEEFARKIADIRVEEMMISNESEIDSIYYNHNLTDITKNYRKMYEDIVNKMNKLRTKKENLLTALVNEAQTSAEEGIDIKDMGIEVKIDGDEGHLVYAIRVVREDKEDGYVEWLELKITSRIYGGTNEYEWVSIYDFQKDTAEKILSEIMENL